MPRAATPSLCKVHSSQPTICPTFTIDTRVFVCVCVGACTVCLTGLCVCTYVRALHPKTPNPGPPYTLYATICMYMHVFTEQKLYQLSSIIVFYAAEKGLAFGQASTCPQ